MTPQEKAKELIQKHTAYAAGGDGRSIVINATCSAKITVDEILIEYDGEDCFWSRVKEELERL